MFEDTLHTLQRFLPGETNIALLENIALQSSCIIFDRAGEALFRAGDPALGFYWLVSGTVQQSVRHDYQILAVSGQLVGIEEFVLGHPHGNPWITITPAEALFINHKGFGYLKHSEGSTDLVYRQMARQLLQAKEVTRPG